MTGAADLGNRAAAPQDLPFADAALGSGRSPMLYYYNSIQRGRRNSAMPTTVHYHRHQHPPGEGHPPAAIAPSILRMSALQRLAVATGLIAVIWGVVIWAMN
jgi:hypothetical protein